MKFNFKAKSKEGGIVSSVFEAGNQAEALASLKQTYETVLFIEPKSNHSLNININFFSSVKMKEKIMFTKNIAGMLEAGIAISRALQILQNKQLINTLKKLLLTLRMQLRGAVAFQTVWPSIVTSSRNFLFQLCGRVRNLAVWCKPCVKWVVIWKNPII